MRRLLTLLVLVTVILPVPGPSVSAGKVKTAFGSLGAGSSLSFSTSAPVIVHPVGGDDVVLPSATYRTTVTVASPRDEARLQELGVTILQLGGGQAVVLADEDQLEALARLRFEPRNTDLFSNLLPPGVGAMATLSAASVVGIASVDDDADGLTNTQESWWGTDPMNPDSDGDGTRDGDEVALLKDWLANRRDGPPASGRPFLGWLDATRDSDRDSVPDMAERWELGLNMNLESTDRDKFDDGQELFGSTNCPGGDLSCGWGELPRSADSGFIGAAMPSWVKAPGKHPLVAAYPVPEIDVLQSSLHVQTVTVVTTDHTIASGTEKSYSTSDTQGTSTSVADTVTWNEWEEVAVATPGGSSADVRAARFIKPPPIPAGSSKLVKALGVIGDVKSALELAETAGKAIGRGINYGFYQFGLHNPGFTIPKWAEDFDNDVFQPVRKFAGCILEGGFECEADSTVPSIGENLVGRQGPVEEGQNLVAGSGGQSRYLDSSGNLVSERVYQAAFPMIAPVPVTTVSHGSEQGGAHTTTTEEYEEHTITNGEAFSNEESWGTATAVDAAHSADLWFTYKVSNVGTEYAREIANLAFNVYIGDNPNPICTYFVGSATCGDPVGSTPFANFMPGEEHQYTSHHIPLTLEQMKAIDLGGPVRIVVEDFTYGSDELFYQNAVNAGVLVAMEDGTDDGDELIDTYLIPTWGDTDTVQDVIGRYFPSETDAEGNYLAIWTPEYRADTPSWCVEPKRTGGTLWCKHALSTADWWNIYMDNLGDGTAALQDTPAKPGSTILFRFNKDSDLDGYSDRSESRLGTDPDDAASHPKPELIAGVHSVRSGNAVTATLSLLNTGLYDAYGVEAVMIAPDDSVSITNNTVGGSGRVKAQKEVIVGSRILAPSYTTSGWTGTAKPASGGYYTGTQDRVYTFTVTCSNPGGCLVGSDVWSVGWVDNTGGSGSLNFGSGYASPSLLSVGAYGVKVSMLSGRVYNGNSFTVKALTPRDTFQYTINREPYTKPVVIVSYNDPQGNHRFITPVDLSAPTDDLVPHSGEMLRDVGVEMVTTSAAVAGTNTTYLVVNNTAPVTLTDAHLFLEFINMEGAVVSEVPVTVTVPPGPTLVPVVWSTGAFTETYDPDSEYIVMAFWTDWEGNILDTAGRPLSSFQEDPRAAFAMATSDEVWDFGTAQQGTLMQRRFVLASVGYMDLLTYIGGATGITVEGPGSGSISPGDMAVYTVTLNTQYMDVGAFERVIPVRTSDPDNPTRTITIRGNVTPMTPDAPGGATLRPLDWTVAVPGDHAQGEWVEYTHTLGPDPASLHPVKVYSQDYSTLWGVGKYATPFGQGTASYDMFGDGRDGDLIINSGEVVFIDDARAAVASSATAGQSTISILAPTTGSITQNKDQFPTQQWTDTGFRVAAGERIRVSWDNRGHPDLHKVCYSSGSSCYGANGSGEPAPSGWTAPGISKFSLVGRIGNGAPFFVGQDYDAVVSQSGELYLGLNDCIGCFADNTVLNGSVGFGFNISVYHSASPSFVAGDEILIMQVTGVGAGNYEFATITSVAGNTLYLAAPLRHTYHISGDSHATLLLVKRYGTVTVRAGGLLTCRQWDGSSGGVCAFRVKDELRIDGGVSAASGGFGGGVATAWSDSAPGYQGASYAGASPQRSSSPNGGGGGGGQNAGGGGGGYGAPGLNGQTCPPGGYGGADYGSPDLSTIYLGSGGGGTSHAYGAVARGGFGGGVVYVIARGVTVEGFIAADGQGGGQPGYTNNYAPDAPLGEGRGGGGGSGGSVKLIVAVANIGNSRVTARGGPGGQELGNRFSGGAGGVGRIRIEYCESLSGSTNPQASVQKLNCYMVEQVESSPYTSGRLNLPESFTSGRTYQVQYGRRYTFAGAGQQTNYLRLNRQMYGSASLDALVSNTGVSSGNLNLCLDFGNDGICDFTHNASTTFPATLQATGWANALNTYLRSRTDVPWGSPVDVPVRVQVDRQSDVMLTNLALTPVGAKTRFLRLPARSYRNVVVSLRFTQPGVPSGPLAFTVDVGADGTVDWSYAGTPTFPAVVTSPDLATVFNAYLTGRTGEVDVPLRIVPGPFLETALAAFSATPALGPDATLTGSDIVFGPAEPTESDEVTVTATVRNSGGMDTGGVVASFFATAPGWGEWYIGSAFVPNVPAGGTAQASIPWNTLGFTGTVPVRVVVDPYNRIAETNEHNNIVTTTLAIRTRPDLQVTQISLSDDEPMVGETVTVTLTLRNHGQTTAGSGGGFTVALYQGNPDAGGTIVGAQGLAPLPGGNTTTVAFTWTPTAPGPYRLFARVDRDNAVNEYDEGNNDTWRDMYVGFAGQIDLDSGGASDVAYAPARGYGYVDEGQPDQVVTSCGLAPEQTMRKDPDGRVVYRFDHLLPGHFYHLDLVLMECDGIGRQESVYVDGNLVAGPVDLGDQERHPLSLRLDPAVYADRVISATVQIPVSGGALVSEISLHDIDYRYSDAGALDEPAYTPERGYGWLDGTRQAGTLPYQSSRMDLGDNALRYQFDGLDPAKKYQLHFTFWQPSGSSTAIEKVQVDGVDTGTSVSVAAGVVYTATVGVMPGHYQEDGSIVVGIVRTNASTGAFVNEIALEEQTQEVPYQCIVPATPNFTNAYGYVLLNGEPAPAGTIVQAFNPRGDVVGCYVVDTVGQYGFMRIYGEDTAVSPPIPGMRDGEMVAFRVNGAKAVATPSLYWEGDKASHRVDLDAGPTLGQTILLPPSQWSLMSFRVRPPVPLVQTVLGSISDPRRYDRVLSETEIFDPGLPPVFNTLKEMHGGQSYYIHITPGATANLLVEGLSMPVTTPLSLHAGWNWAGYLPDVTLPVTVALQSIEGKYLLVHSTDKTFDPALPTFSTLKQMKPGEGYLIRMTEAANLVYPASGGAQAMSEAEDVGLCTDALPTPYFTVLYGTLWVNGVPALPGTKVEMLTPRGEVAGCFVVQQGGRYGFVHVYGADGTGTPGFRQGEAVRFRVNGREVVPSAPVLWGDDKMPHRVDVGARTIRPDVPPVQPEEGTAP